jgi:hypothetical protein
MSSWYTRTKLGEVCDNDTHCVQCESDGVCFRCDSVDGRFEGVVSEYASTCDGPCSEQTHHDLLTSDPETQLGYCEACIVLLSPDIQKRLAR